MSLDHNINRCCECYLVWITPADEFDTHCPRCKHEMEDSESGCMAGFVDLNEPIPEEYRP